MLQEHPHVMKIYVNIEIVFKAKVDDFSFAWPSIFYFLGKRLVILILMFVVYYVLAPRVEAEPHSFNKLFNSADLLKLYIRIQCLCDSPVCMKTNVF